MWPSAAWVVPLGLGRQALDWQAPCPLPPGSKFRHLLVPVALNTTFLVAPQLWKVKKALKMTIVWGGLRPQIQVWACPPPCVQAVLPPSEPTHAGLVHDDTLHPGSPVAADRCMAAPRCLSGQGWWQPRQACSCPGRSQFAHMGTPVTDEH